MADAKERVMTNEEWMKEAELKRCIGCGIEKPRSSFYKHATNLDGLTGRCRSCKIALDSERRRLNPEGARAVDRRRANHPERKASIRARLNRNEAEFPERKKVRMQAQHAVRTGKLERQPCFVCGGKAEAHHPDYDRPLAVVWLCRAHHRQTHAMIESKGRRHEHA